MNSKNIKTLIQGVLVSLVVTTSAFALVIIPAGSTTTDPTVQGYPTCIPGDCVVAGSTGNNIYNSTTSNIISGGTTTIGGPVTNLNSTTTNITSGGTTSITSVNNTFTSSTTNINSSSTVITGTTTVQSFVLGTLTGILTAINGVVGTGTVSLINQVAGILGISFGGTGTTTAPTYGQILLGNAGGTYDLVSTSSLGISGGSSASSTFASSTTIGGKVYNATSTGIFFLDASGNLAQDVDNFNYDPVTKKFTVTGGVDPLYLQLKDVTTPGGSGAYFEAFAGNNAATSSVGNGRIRYNASTTVFETSVNGGAWIAIGSGSSQALASGTATNTTLRWNGIAWVENTNFLTDAAGNATMTSATSTNFFSNLLTALSAVITNLVATTANIATLFGNNSNFITSNASTTNASTSNASSSFITNLQNDNATITNATITNLSAGNVNLNGINAVNGTITNSTSTNTFATNSSTTNSTSSNLFSNNSVIQNSTTTNLYSDNASITNATTTNLFAVVFNALTAYFENLGFGSATGTNIQLANATTTNLVATGTMIVVGTSTLATTTVSELIIANATTQLASLGYSNLVIGSDGVVRKAPSINALSDVLDNTVYDPTLLTPAVGDSYLLSGTSSVYINDWLGATTTIQTWNGTTWDAYIPSANDKTTVTTGTNAGNIYIFDGTNWAVQPITVSSTWNLGGNTATGTQTFGTLLFGAINFVASNTSKLFISGTTTLGVAIGTTTVSSSALTVSSATTTGNVMDIFGNNLTTGNALSISSAGTSTTGNLFKLNVSSTSSLATALNINNVGLGLSANIQGAIALQSGTDYATSSIFAHDVDFGNTSFVRVLATTTRFLGITGIKAGSSGQLLTMVNASSTGNFIIYNSTTTSLSANRIITGTGANITMAPDQSINLIYDASSAKWRVVGGSGGTSAAGTTVVNISGAATTTTLTAWSQTVLVDASTGNQTIVLPTAIGNSGSFMEIKRVDSSANFVTIDGFSSQTIDGNATINLYANGVGTQLRSDGANVRQIADYNNGVTASYIQVTGTSSSFQTTNITVGTDHVKFQNGTVQSYGNDISFDGTTTYSSANNTQSMGLYTLKAGKTYRLSFVTPWINYSGANAFTIFNWVNADTGALLSTSGGGNYNRDGGSDGGSGAVVETVFTPTVDTRVKVKMTGGQGTITQIGNGSYQGSNGSAMIQVIAGNSPVIGQSVDFVNAGLSSTQSVTAVDTNVQFNSVVSGNIPVTNGVFTLSAGKTYELEGAIYWTLSSGLTDASYVVYGWADATTGTLLSTVSGTALIKGDAVTSSTGYSTQQAAKLVYTPSTNQTVVLRVKSFSNITSLTLSTGANNNASTYAVIKQLGTSATTEYENNILGNFTASGTVMTGTLPQYTNFIQIAQASSSITLTLPNPTNTNLSRLVYVDNTGTANFDMHGISVLAGESAAFKWNGTTWKAFGNKYEVGAEYGESVLSSIIATTNSTLNSSSVAVLTATIPSAGVWEIIYPVFASNQSTGSNNAVTAGLFNSSNTLVTNSQVSVAQQSSSSAGNQDTAMSTGVIRVTTTGAETYTLRAAHATVAMNVVGGGAVNGTGYTKISWKKIGGFAPVVGQTVDYIKAEKTNTQTGMVSGTDIIFNTVNSGNIPLNTTTGVFTLTAGKTYELIGAASFINMTGVNGQAVYIWVDAVTNAQLGGQTFSAAGVTSATSTGTQTSQPLATVIYTPTTNQTVKLRLASVPGYGTTGTMDILPHGTVATIKQLGTSATTGFSFSAMTNQLVNNTLDNFAYTNIWNWSSSTSTSALKLVANALTTGTLFNLVSTTSSSTALALNVDGASAFSFSNTNFATSSVYANNVDFGNTSRVRVLATTSVFLGITGIAGGSNGEQLTIVNASSTAGFKLFNHTTTASSTASNRIITGTGADLTVAADTAIQLVYDSSASTTGRWIVVGGSGSGGSNFVAADGVTTATDTVSFMGRLGSVAIGTTSRVSIASSSALYVAGEIWNTLATTSIKLASQATIVQSPYAVAIKGNIAYVTLSGAQHGLAIVDISNPNNMTQITNNVQVSGAQPRWASVNGDYLYVLNFAHNSINTYDISTPNIINLVASTSLSGVSPNQMVINGSYAYVANRGSTFMTILDLKNPANPVQVATTSVGSTQSSFTLDGRYMLSANHGSNTVSIFDLRDPLRPTTTGSITAGSAVLNAPWSIVKNGRFIYVSNSGASTVSVYRQISGNTYTGVNNITVGAGPMGLTQQGKYLYVANNGANSINILDTTSSSTAPHVAASTTLASFASSPIYVNVVGRYAYVPGNNAVSNVLSSFSLGGIDTSSLSAGSLQTGDATVSGNAEVAGLLSTRSLNVGLGGINSFGALALLGTATSTNGLGTTTLGASLYIASSTPATTTNSLYQQGGTLYWNGSVLGLSLFGTANTAVATPYANNVDFGNNITSASISATTTAFLGITGFATGTNGTVMTIVNASSTGNFILYNQSASSSPAGRIITGQGADITIPGDATVQLKYDSIAARWRVIGSWLPAGSATLVTNVTASTTLTTWGRTVLVDATSGPLTVTLPNPVGNSGGLIELKRIDSTTNVVTVEGHASSTIDGSFNLPLTNTNVSMNIRSNGTNAYTTGGSGSYVAGAIVSAYKSADTTISIGTGNITFNTETIDTLNSYATTTSIFTAPSAGYYEFNANMIWDNQSGQSDDTFDFEVRKNGVVYKSVVMDPGATIDAGEEIEQSVVTFVQLTAGEQVSFTYTGVTDPVVLHQGSALNISQLSGQAAVTGQSVDYINVTRTTAQTVADDAPILFLNTVAGNIPYNSATGQFSLTAGKTYRLEAGIRQDNTTNATWKWTTAAGIALNSQGGACHTKSVDSGDSSSSQQICTIIYTPTVDTNVRVQNISGASKVIALDSNGSTYAIITQLGSSATTEYENNILGNFTADGYIATGTLSQYTNFFQIAQASTSRNLLLPTPANTALGRLVYVDNTGTANFTMYNNVVAAGESAFYKWNGTAWKSLTSPTTVASETGYVVMNGQTNNTNTYVNSTNGIYTIPSAGTWRLSYDIVTDHGNGSAANSHVRIADSVNALIDGSERMRTADTARNYMSATVYVTTSGPTTYNLQIRNGGGGTITLFSDSTNDSTISWEKISGYIPVNGQTVDYIQVSGSASYTLGANGTAVIPPSPTTVGNIPYNSATGVFSLEAGKTYNLEGALGFTGSDTYYQWRDITGNVFLGVAGTVVDGNNLSRNALASAIFTPTVDTTVRLQVIAGGSTVVDSSVDGRRTFMKITQLGSTAFSTGISFDSLRDALANWTIDNTNFAQIWNWSTATSSDAFTLNGLALTTGSLLTLNTSSSSNALEVNGLSIFTGTSTFATSTFASTTMTWSNILTLLANNATITNATSTKIFATNASITAATTTRLFSNILLVSGTSTLSTTTASGLLSVLVGGPGPKIVANFGNSDSGALTSEARIVLQQGTAWYQGITGAFNNAAPYLGFSVNTVTNTWAERMRISNSGAVSIGTTSAPGFFTVMGTGTANIAVFQSVGGTGCTLSGTGVLSCSSDETFKNNISISTYGLDSVLALTPKTFNWNSDIAGATTTIGFIAQDVEKVLPSLVTKDSNGKLALNQTGMIPLLVKAIQDMNSKIFASAPEQAISIEEITASSTISVDAKLKALGMNAKTVNDMLAELASSTSATTTISTTTIDGVEVATSTQTFVGKLIARIVEVVKETFAKQVLSEEICVGTAENKTCLTKTQLDNLLNNSANANLNNNTNNNNNNVQNNNNSGEESGGSDTTADNSGDSGSEITDTTTDETETETASVPVEEPASVPAVTPDLAPAI